MGSLGPALLTALLLAVALVAGASGFVASTVARTKKRGAREFFALGFVCGITAGVILRRRRRGVNLLLAPLRLGLPHGYRGLAMLARLQK